MGDFPKLAVFKDWYLFNAKNDIGYGLLDCTYHQALQWAVAHVDLSWEWGVIAAEDIVIKESD